MSYCYHHGSFNIHIDVNKKNKQIIIFIRSEISYISNEDLDLLEKSLNTPRLHEMEEYYWNLTGDSDTGVELTLVGMMIDEAHVNYVDGKYLEILLTRYP
jgi:hypothetical protein